MLLLLIRATVGSLIIGAGLSLLVGVVQLMTFILPIAVKRVNLLVEICELMWCGCQAL